MAQIQEQCLVLQEGDENAFTVTIRRNGTPIDLSDIAANQMAFEIRDKPASDPSGSSLYVRLTESAGDIVRQTPSTDGRVRIKVRDTDNASWKGGVSSLRVIFTGNTRPTTVGRWKVTLNRKETDSV